MSDDATEQAANSGTPTKWHRVADLDELPEGRVKTVTVGHTSLCLSHFEGDYGTLANSCPHQGGPLGEGSIENGWLRCPWHGYDYHPLTGKPPAGFSNTPDCFKTEARDDGVYVQVPGPVAQSHRVGCARRDDDELGCAGRVRHGRPFQPRVRRRALRRAEERGDVRFFGIRHEGAAAFAAGAYGKLTGELAACFGIAGPGSTNLLTGLYDAKVDRARCLRSRVRCRRRTSAGAPSKTSTSRPRSPTWRATPKRCFRVRTTPS